MRRTVANGVHICNSVPCGKLANAGVIVPHLLCYDFEQSQVSPKTSQRAEATSQRGVVVGICIALVAIVAIVFAQTATFPFVDYDDGIYVYDNPVVQDGLTLYGLNWALRYGEIGHWHPLTWLSHMVDCQVYGLHAGGHHVTNVALQAAAAALLFLAFNAMTGSMWRSGFVAAVFAIHPLRVESVAWIAERKDVLSGMFFMLTLWAYGRYVRRPSVGKMAVAASAFALGLLSKNTLVTLPFVLLLLDWWPLRREAPLRTLILEKIALFALSAGSCIVTFLSPEKVPSSGSLPLFERLGNAAVSYVVYLRQMFYPAGLAAPYPTPPNGWPLLDIAGALLLLVAVSIAVVVCRKERPYLVVGWLWYLGMLIPAIGIVQISYYSHADRYTYLPGIGIDIAVTWMVADWFATRKSRNVILGGLMACVITSLMVCAWNQTTYWKSSESLWRRALSCTSSNYFACNNLGSVLRQKGDVDGAIKMYQEALLFNPNSSMVNYNLGIALQQNGKLDDAIAAYEKAERLAPEDGNVRANLGHALLLKGDITGAIVHLQKAVEIDPGMVQASRDLDRALALQEKNQTK